MKRFFYLLLVILYLLPAAGCGQKSGVASDPDAQSSPTRFDSAALEDYVIVYPAGNADYAALANRLADHLLEKYDVFLTTVGDADSQPTACEIILGDTNRFDEATGVMEYAVTVKDGKLWVRSGGLFSAEKAVNELCQMVFTGQPLVLEPGVHYEASFLPSPQGLGMDSAVRIMSANLLADAFADSSYRSAFYRAEIFAGMLVAYTPDVLGLQEVDAAWNQALPYYLDKLQKVHGLSYALCLDTYEGMTNYTSLLYRSDKFQVADSGLQVFSWWVDPAFRHDYHMRNISWAQFTPLDASQAPFMVANTHWSYRTEHSDGNRYLSGATAPIAINELRTQCKDETNAFLSSLRQSNPDLPILLTGDFNTSLPFFTESGWTPTGFALISEAARDSGRALSIVPESGHFDHIFGAGNYKIDCYAFFKDTDSHSLLTDHPFVYTDFLFS